jgi:hypothetical protein
MSGIKNKKHYIYEVSSIIYNELYTVVKYKTKVIVPDYIGHEVIIHIRQNVWDYIGGYYGFVNNEIRNVV